MAFLTDRKRAVGLGAAGAGTEHFWSMTVSSAGLLVLTPLFVWVFGRALGGGYAEVAATFARPVPALIAVLFLVTGWLHFKNGVQVLIEDYTRGLTQKALIIGTACLSYAAAAAALFAIARVAL
ncbi:MAG: succinate dehydrogenase, hydrophobic membrane anchor protein [Shimia sp.]